MTTVSSTDRTSQAVSDPSGALASAAGGKALGKDAFLKLLVAQIQHQDPMKPMDDTAFVSQLAQYSALEQQLGTNTRLDTMSAQQKGVANTEIAALVGKTVTINGDTATLSGDGTGSPVRFTLGAPATDVNVTIKDGAGNIVRTIKLGAEPSGTVKFTWDGKNDSGQTQPAGIYKVSVDAKAAGGGSVQVTQQTSGVLKSVSFDEGYAKLTLADGTSAPASNLVSVDAPLSFNQPAK